MVSKKDPDTGGWSDFEHQQVFSYYKLEADRLSGQYDTYVLDDIKTVDPLDGNLGEDEYAELVSLNIGILKCYMVPAATRKEHHSSGPTHGQAMFEVELSFNPTSEIQASAKEQVDTVGDGDIRVIRKTGTSQDVLWFGESRMNTAFNDGDGAGGGATSEISDNVYFINYRNEYGKGPVVDSDDELHEHVFWGANIDNDVANEDVEGILGYSLVWDILDTK